MRSKLDFEFSQGVQAHYIKKMYQSFLCTDHSLLITTIQMDGKYVRLSPIFT